MGPAIVSALVSLVLSLPAVALAPSAPVFAHDFPDPAVVLAGGTYWAYGTGSAGRNLQVMSSRDLTHWSSVEDPLPVLPRWAAVGDTWAPGVVQRDGEFVMYYTVRDAAAGRQCISEATSPTPAGPFVDTSAGPLVCQLGLGGSIDPNPFVDTGGATYLLWKSDGNAIGQKTRLWAQRLSSDARRLTGAAVQVLSEDATWQAPSVEGPTVVRTPVGYDLFYSANNYATASSGIGYAVCTTVLGPCVDASLAWPWLSSYGAAEGPQGPWVFRDSSGHTRLAYAAWDGPVGYANGGVRSLWIGTLEFAGPVPLLV